MSAPNSQNKYLMSPQLSTAAGLIIVALLGGLGPEYPIDGSAGSSWHFLLTHPTELLHATLGVALLCHIAVHAAKSRWQVLPVLTLVGASISVCCGIAFVTERTEILLVGMSVGWLVALTAVIIEHFKLRKNGATKRK